MGNCDTTGSANPKQNKKSPSPSNIRIRQAKPTDAAAICQIQRKTWIVTYISPENGVSKQDLEEMTSAWISDKNITDFAKKIVSTQPKTWLVAEIDNKVVGHICAKEQENGQILIEMFYILPGYQGGGLGRKMLNEIFQTYPGREIVLYVIFYNKRAIDFYQKNGFEAIALEENSAPPLPSGAKAPRLIKMSRRVL